MAAGCNVVIHEFAHKIDMVRGDANGYPPFLAAYHQGLAPERWQRGFTAAYADFRDRVDALERSLPPDFDPDDEADAAYYDELAQALPLDPYAAHNPAEFFAVASEAFFVQPGPLAADYPEIYRLLAQYYRQDPLAPMPNPEPKP
jgi:Mlc titration factor MtfA (ptsG expression regulator)